MGEPGAAQGSADPEKDLASRAETLLARLNLAPAQPEAYVECARLLQRLERREEAVDVLIAGAAQHEDPMVLRPLGMALAEAGRKEEARETWQRVLAVDPSDYDGHNNLGVLLQEAGRLGEAIESLRRAANIDPRNASALNNLGVALAEARRLEESVACYRRALALAPDFTIAWNNMGNALRGMGQSEEAAVALKTAIRLRPDYAEAYNNLAITYAQLEDSTAAMEAFDQSIFLRPDYPEAHMNRGLQYLLQGDFRRGWADYEWRWHEKLLKPRYAKLKRWDGSNVVGKRVLVYYEQGLGDTFNFIRYAAELKARGAHVIFECQPAVREILSRTPGIDAFVIRGQPLPAADLGAPLLSLPGVLQSNLETLPARVPYIFTDPELVQRWRRRLADIPGFRVGIVWQGNPNHRGDWKRSIPLRQFEALSRIPGVTLISLQKGFGEEQLAALNGRFPVRSLAGMGDDEEGFLRTAAILKNIDLVVCADTSIAHLAGAMGVPAWVLLPVAPDWRWLLGREDSPWYPSLRLFRQKRIHDWASVFERIVEALQGLVAIGSTRAVDETRRKEAGELHRRAIERLGAKDRAGSQQLLERAVALDPGCTAAHHDLGVIRAQEGRLAEAIAHLRRAIELEPDSATAHANIGMALQQNRQFDEAIAHFNKAIRLGGGSGNVYNDLGSALLDCDRAKEAEAALWAALRIDPFHPRAHFNLARAFLVQGNYTEGWLEYEWRSRLVNRPPPRQGSRWTGALLKDQVVLITAEQGVAETLQFARYCRLVRQRGGRPILKVQRSLVELMGASGLADAVISGSAPPPAHAYTIPLLDLPGTLHTTLQTIPADTPYIHAPQEAAAGWRERLAAVPRPRLAICWPDAEASPALPAALMSDVLSRLAQIEGLSLVSLTAPPAGVEIPERLGPRLHIVSEADLPGDAFVRHAAILANVDAVVSPDTALAHLAGAMNVPTFLVLPRGASWKWLLQRSDSPWYPSMRLFREREMGGWGPALDELCQAAASLLHSASLGAQTPRVANVSRREQLSRDGQAARGRRDFATAVDRFEEALRVDPDSVADLHNLGVACLQAGQSARAIRSFEAVLARQPRCIPAISNLAGALAAEGQVEKAIERVTGALAADPDAFELHYRLGLLRLSREEKAEARRSFLEAVRIRPDSAIAHLQLARIAFEGREIDEAQRHAERAAASGDLAAAHDILARVALASGDLAAAGVAAEAAVQREPEVPERHALQAQVLERQGRQAEAIAALQRALYRAPGDDRYHRHLARLHAAQGNLADLLLHSQRLIPKEQQGSVLVARRGGQGAVLPAISLVAPDSVAQTIFLLRFVPLLQVRVGSVRLHVRPEFAPLFRGAVAGVDAVVAGAPASGGVPVVHLAAVPFLLSPPPALVRPEGAYLVPCGETGGGGDDLVARGDPDGRSLVLVFDKEGIDADVRRTSVALAAAMGTLAGGGGLRLVGRGSHPAVEGQAQDGAGPFRAGAAEAEVLCGFASLLPRARVLVTNHLPLLHLAGAMHRPAVGILPFAGAGGWHHKGAESPWYRRVKTVVAAVDETAEAAGRRVAAEAEALGAGGDLGCGFEARGA
jgi:tetratricopeptide (TPR) repeat protein